MFAERLTVIAAFAGGCLCTALIGFWSADSKPRARVVSERRASVLVSSLAADPAASPELQPEPPRAVADVGEGPSEDIGTSVADVLTRLETAYQIVSAAKAVDRAASESAVPVAPEPAREPQAIVAPAAVAEHTPSAPAPEPMAAPAPAAVSPAPAEVPPASDAMARAPDAPTYIGQVNTNIQLGEVQLGDRYEVQQLAMLQYLQLLALSSYVGGRQPRTQQTPRTPAGPRYPITAIPNPDNPWGFNFPPRVLVK